MDEVPASRKDKPRELRLRRMARRQNLTLTRSRYRDPHATGFGLYFLWRDTPNQPTRQLLTDEQGVTLDLVEDYLTNRDQR